MRGVRLQFVIALLITASCCRQVFATLVLDNYDLDSLVSLSQVIVKGELGQVQTVQVRDGKADIRNLKITAVYRGDVKVDQVVTVSGLEMYHHAPGIMGEADSWEKLAENDQVVLFLVPAKSYRGFVIFSEAPADYTPINSGVRLIKDPNVYSFQQSWPSEPLNTNGKFVPEPMPGYLASTPTTSPKQQIVLSSQLDHDLAQAIQNVDSAHAILDRCKQTHDAGHAIQVLEQRAQAKKAANQWGRDAISEEAAVIIGEFATPEQIDQLIVSPRGMYVPEILKYSLEGRGREYLLQRLQDKGTSEAERKRYSDIIRDAGWPYQSSFANSQDVIWADFATRVAESVVKDPDSPIVPSLLECLEDSTTNDPVKYPVRSGLLRNDLLSASRVLQTGKSAKPETMIKLKSAIDKLNGSLLRPTTQPTSSGEILTRIEPLPDQPTFTSDRHVHAHCGWDNRLAPDAKGAHLELIARRVGIGPEVILMKETRGCSTTGTTGQFDIDFEIPASFQKERYEVFFRPYINDQSLAEGLGFEAFLPSYTPTPK